MLVCLDDQRPAGVVEGNLAQACIGSIGRDVLQKGAHIERADLQRRRQDCFARRGATIKHAHRLLHALDVAPARVVRLAVQRQQRLQRRHDLVADRMPQVLLLVGADPLALDVLVHSLHQVGEYAGQQAEFVATAQSLQIVLDESLSAAHRLAHRRGARCEQRDTADNPRLDREPGQQDRGQHRADEPVQAPGHEAKPTVHVTEVAAHPDFIVAHGGCNESSHLERAILVIHRQASDQAGDQRRWS